MGSKTKGQAGEGEEEHEENQELLSSNIVSGTQVRYTVAYTNTARNSTVTHASSAAES